MREAFFGHPLAGQMLANALRRGRLAHTYLFVGPRGVGKLRAAKAFGRVAACRSPRGDGELLAPCGECPSCALLFEPGSHHDLQIVERSEVGASGRAAQPAGEEDTAPPAATVLSQELKLRDFEAPLRLLHKAPAVAARRVLIIPEAERMDQDASGYLLKTLEEPLPRTLIILTTTNPAGLVPTILSRCQHVHFPLVPEDVVLQALRESGVAEERAQFAARLAAGRLELARKLARWPDAEEFYGEVLGHLRGALSGDRLAQMQAAEGLRRACLRWWEFCEGQELASGASHALEERAVRLGAPDVLAICESWLRDMLAVRLGVARAHLANQRAAEELAADAQRFTPGQLVQRVRAAGETRRRIQQNVNTRLALEAFALSIGPGQPVLALAGASGGRR